MPKVLAVPSEQATNETSRLMDKPPITKEESKDLACLIFINTIIINNTVIGDNTNKCISRKRTIRENSRRRSCRNSSGKSCYKGGNRRSSIHKVTRYEDTGSNTKNSQESKEQKNKHSCMSKLKKKKKEPFHLT